MTRFQVPLTVRLRWPGKPPARPTAGEPAAGRDWVVEDLASQRRFATSDPVADVVARLMADRGAERDDLVALLRSRHGLPESAATRTLDLLTRLGIIRPDRTAEADPADRHIRDLRQAWEARDWSSAAQFQIHTNDYPFIDYLRGGRETDLERMAAYSADQADLERGKRYEDVPETVPLPPPRMLPELGQPLWDGDPLPCPRADLDSLSPSLSLIFAKTGQARLPWTNSAPAYLRTSPSGGSRHPVEAYLLNLSIAGLAGGWWHIRWDEPALDRLTGEVSAADAAGFLPGAVGRASFTPVAAIVFTLVFSRNMYRYREPRTFRAVHMDAGHLIGMAELTLGSHGYRTLAHHWVDVERCSQTLGLDPLTEGCISGLAIGVAE
jgi:SagB-type dehydrogenase family enzyme